MTKKSSKQPKRMHLSLGLNILRLRLNGRQNQEKSPKQPLAWAGSNQRAVMWLILPAILLLMSACSTAQKKEADKPQLALPKLSLSLQVPQCVSIAAVGDIMLGGSALGAMQRNGYDYAFAKTVGIFQSADIVTGNLETALTLRGTRADKKYTFRNPPQKVIPALKQAGFNLISLANNHTVDYGVTGLKDTLDALEQAKLAHVGAGMNLQQARKAHIISIKGQKFGFLAYSLTYPQQFWATSSKAGTAFGHARHIKQDVAALKQQVDHVVVHFHWGREGYTKLRPYQPNLARLAIDAGASLILGHHPHVLQGIEQYKNGLIYYSLGNFAFGSYSRRANTGGIAKVKFCPQQTQAGIYIVDVNNYRVQFQPRLAKNKIIKQNKAQLQQLSPTIELHQTADKMLAILPTAVQ